VAINQEPNQSLELTLTFAIFSLGLQFHPIKELPPREENSIKGVPKNES